MAKKIPASKLKALQNKAKYGGKKHAPRMSKTSAPKIDKRHHVSSAEWAKSGQWVKAISSNLRSIAYIAHKEYLYVEFKGNSVYRYDGVPAQVARNLFNASSLGKYLHRNVKGKYSYTRIK